MGTLLFLAMRYLGMINTANDLIVICFLVSIDSIALLTLMNSFKSNY